MGDENTPEQDSSGKEGLADGENAPAGDLPEDSETENGEGASTEDVSGDSGLKGDEDTSGDDGSSENGDSVGDGKEDSNSNTPEDVTGTGTETDETQQPSEEQPVEDEESNTDEGEQDETPQEPGDEAGDEEELIASGTSYDISWKIDKNGKLSITGSGDYEFINNGTPWASYGEKIISAEVNVTGMTSARNMFYRCTKLESIDLSNFDTSQVTDMSSMFYYCRQLVSLDLRSFDTSKVTDMRDMFYGCYQLISLDLRSFDTSKVTDMRHMFCGCNLVSLDLSNFDTSQVTNMYGMFSGCDELESLNLRSFDTSQVTDMSYMFNSCSKLVTLNLSNFETNHVTDMYSMFNSCSNLTDLDVSGFNTSRVTDMGSMFYGCSNLTDLDVSGFNTSRVSGMGSMFYGCSNLTGLDVSGFNTSRVTDMGSMFYGCSNLTSLDLSSFNTSRVTNMSSMFYNCESLESLVLDSFEKSQLSSMNSMFYGCKSLESLDLSGFDISQVKKASNMLSLCGNLTHISTPKNCMVNIALPVNDDTEIWYCGSKVCTTLPLELDYSIDLYKNAYPGDGTIDSKLYISGLSIKSKTYDGNPCAYEGNIVVKDIEDKLISDISVSCTYQGKFENGSEYAETEQAPSQAGKYTLTVLAENDTYSTQRSYKFNIYPADVSISACSVSIEVGDALPELSGLIYDMSGLLKEDKLLSEPQFKYSVENIDTSKPGLYDIIPYDADAGNNYNIHYGNGLLEVGEAMIDSGKANDISWGITYDGKLIIEGTGDYGNSVPWNKSKFLDSINTVVVNVSGITSTKGMFAGLGELEGQRVDFDFSNFDTSNVTDMSNMFSGCELGHLDLGNINTSKVTNMSGMFSSGEAEYMSLSNFSANQFANMSGCDSLDLSSFDTSNVTDMSNMFYGRRLLANLDLSNWDTSKVTNMRGMFSHCEYLESLDLSSFNTSNVTDMSHMFAMCSLSNLDLSNFNTSKVTNMSGMFAYCGYYSWGWGDDDELEDNYEVYDRTHEGLRLDLSSFDTSNVTDMSDMFDSAKLRSLDISSFNTSRVTNMNGMFCGYNLGNLDLSSFDMGKVESADNMISGEWLFHIFTPKNCSINVLLPDADKGQWCQDAEHVYTALPIGLNDSIELFWYENGYTGDAVNKGTINNISWEIDKNGKLTITGTGDYISDSGDVPPWSGNGNITSAVVDISGITSTRNMFYNCKGLASVDLSKLDTSMVTDMSNMFKNCYSLGNLDLSNFNTGKVTNMSYMFSGCNVVNLNLNNFDTSQVTDMSGMFRYCGYSGSLDLSNFNTSKVTNMSKMFKSCRVDNLNISSFDTSKVTDMNSMFSGCFGKCNVDLSNFNTSQVTDMSQMFRYCRFLSVDVSSFDTSKVTDMSAMFAGCINLVSLDVSNFDTSNVTYMSEMFKMRGWDDGKSGNLLTLDLSNFDMSKVTDASDMLECCDELMYIRTPKHCGITVYLPDGYYNYNSDPDWYQDIDSICDCLPRDLDYSIDLYRGGYPGDGTIKRIAFISGVSIEDKTYDGKPDTYVGNALVKDAEGNEINDIPVSYSYQGTLKDGSKYTKTQQAPTQAGTYTLLVTAENDTYAAQMSYSFNIYQKEISIRANSVTIGTDEELPKLSELTYTIDGLLGTDNLTKEPQFKYSAEDISTAEEGTYDIIPYGADAGNNYRIKYVNGTLTIAEDGGSTNKQTVSISGITIADKIYDAVPISYTGNAVVKDSEENIITDVTTSFSYQGTLADGNAYASTTQAPAQAGSYTLTFTIAENDKYTAEPAVYDFTIDKKEVTITAPSVTIKTGEQLPDLTGLTCNVTGLIGGDELITQPQLRYSVENISTATEGSYYIIPSDADAGNNYSIEYINGVLTISNSDTPTYEDVDDSSYNDDERTALNSISGTIAAIKAKTYDGLPYEPVLKVTVTENGKKKTLTEGTDYRVIYKNNVDAGTTGKATVKGNGIYKGEISQTFTIKPKSIKKLKIVTGGITGSLSEADIANPLTKIPVYVYDGSVLLGRGEDYTLSLKASTDKAVTLNIAAVENTNYTGTTTAKLTIYDGTDSTTLINPEHVTVGGRKQPETYEATYTGKAIKPEVAVKIGGTDLTNKDYKVSYQNNKDAGTAYVIVTGKGQYKGKAVIPFKIVSLRSDLQITNTIKDKVYNGKLQKPPVTVKAGTAKLKKNKDYTIAYTKNLHAGTATITVTGRGNYTGKATATFNINKQNIKKVSVKVNQSGVIDVYYGKILLRKESDYKLEFGAQKGNGKIEVTVTATDESDFTGSMTKVVKVPVYIPVLKEANKTIEKEVGDTYQLQFEKPESGAVSIASIECESSNPEVASVDNNGLITIKKAGAVVIKVYANNRKSVQQCFVIVKGDEENNLPEGKTGLTYHQKAGTTDDTKGINALLQEWEYDPELCDYVYIPAGVYRIDAVDGGIGIGGIILRDNQTLLISPSAIIMAIGNNATNSQVIYAFGRKNVTISGGQIIGERNEHQGKGGEWGHGISIQGCTNVTIKDMDISQCWGDGICLGEYDTRDSSGKLIHKPSDKITIENCVLHHNRRNNLSITDAKHVTVNNCQFNYAKGTDPQYGICIEYNFTPTENVEIYNSTFKGNAKASMGIMKKATNVRLENCTLDGKLYNMAGKNVVLKNTTVAGGIVGDVKKE